LIDESSAAVVVTEHLAYLPQFQDAIIEILPLNKNREEDEVSKKRKERKETIYSSFCCI
jgi:hypothetical protein